MENKPKAVDIRDPFVEGGGLGNDAVKNNEVPSNEFPTDLRNLSEADKKKWFRVEEVGGGLSVLKVRTELVTFVKEEGEPGFLDKKCSYKVTPKQEHKLMFDKDF